MNTIKDKDFEIERLIYALNYTLIHYKSVLRHLNWEFKGEDVDLFLREQFDTGAIGYSRRAKYSPIYIRRKKLS